MAASFSRLFQIDRYRTHISGDFRRSEMSGRFALPTSKDSLWVQEEAFLFVSLHEVKHFITPWPALLCHLVLRVSFANVCL